MKNFRFLMLALLTFYSVNTVADDHQEAPSSAVELWVCDYQDGKSIEDLRAWYKDFNVLSDKMENGDFRSWLWTPYFHSDLEAADVVVATSFPNLASMGQSMMEFFGGPQTGALFARFETIVDCHGRELWMVEQTRD